MNISFEGVDLNKLKIPISRIPKRLFTVEASTRLDAVASSGFGVSRAKIVSQIKQGQIRINWELALQPNRTLEIGDNVQLEGKGSLEILTLELTKRQRWRIELLRK